jgi:tryptophan-rich sensory protein
MTDTTAPAQTPPGRAGGGLLAAFSVLLFAALTFGFAALGSSAPSGDENPWFRALEKPPINPPSIIFPLVWTPLYMLMAVSMSLVWWRTGWRRAFVLPFTLFVVQLALNAAWTWLFFGARMPWLAFAEILLLWATIAAMIRAFWQVRPLAGMLQLPYLAWVSFAALLNGWFAVLN